MPRSPRAFLEGGIYHVYNRVTRGERVFGEDEEALLLLDTMRKVNRCQVRSYGVSWKAAAARHGESPIIARSRASYRLAKSSSSRRCRMPSRAR
ncbi:MAG: hypothetical protein P8127_16735 [Acidobacteriota bacterium]